MIWPPLIVNDETLRWPLSAPGAGLIIHACVAGAADERTRRFAELLAHDETAGTWASYAVPRDAAPAAWLAEHWPRVFVWPDAVEGGWLAECLDCLRRLAELERDFDAALVTAKVEALKEFAYGAGHELNNPLANIATRAQTLLKDEPHPERRRRLAAINAQAFRAHEMIADLMLFARPAKLDCESFVVETWLNEVVAEILDGATRQHTEIHCHVASEVRTLVADAGQLHVALQAVLQNALEALGEGGRVQLFAERDPVCPETLLVTVRDNGPGISSEMLPKVFDPYFSGREAGRGLGFGLCKAWRIVTAHGGTIRIDSQVGAGTAVLIRVPLAGPRAQAIC